VRIKEAQALGFATVLLPAGNLAALDRKELPDIDCLGVRTVREALQRVF
jgi:predicted ATP-dependent serine protease